MNLSKRELRLNKMLNRVRFCNRAIKSYKESKIPISTTRQKHAERELNNAIKAVKAHAKKLDFSEMEINLSLEQMEVY